MRTISRTISNNFLHTRLRARIIGAALLAICIVAFGIPASAKTKPAYEFSAVSSSNDALPSIIVGTSDLEDSVTIQICEGLRQGRSHVAIAHKLGLPGSELQSRIDALVRAELLRPGAGGTYAPTFPIIHRADVAWFRGIDRALIDATVRAIEARQQELRTRFRDALHLDSDQERALSLVLFGDTLFDRWQTRNVRTGFLPGYPPARAGKEFYLAALQKAPGKIGSLGMYTHSEPRYGEIIVVTYGHTKVLDPFANEKPESVPKLIEAYVAFARGSSPATSKLLQLGLVLAGKPAIAIVSQSAYAKLPEITKSFTDELLGLLNADRPKIVDAYQSSPYAATVSFQEFALWWYHFFDAAVTDRLIEDGVIAVPPAGYAAMIVIPGQ
jgi:hypothetical protein